MRANSFFVDVVSGDPLVSVGIPVVQTESGWAVPLGECFNCGADTFLRVSSSNSPEILISGTDTTKGKILWASVIESRKDGRPSKKLRRPDENAIGLRALVMLGHFDELEQGAGTYEVLKEGTGVLMELYRGAVVKFRCPQGIDRYGLTFDGSNLACMRLTFDGRPEQPEFAGIDADAAKLESFGIPTQS